MSQPFRFPALRVRGPIVAIALMALSPSLFAADDPDRLQQRATLYLWAAGIDATTAAGDTVSIGFDDIMSNLNMAFMGAYDLRKGPWSAGLDLIYLNIGANGGADVPVQAPGPLGISRTLKVNAGVKQRGWVVDLHGARNLIRNERLELDALVGVRYLELKLDFKLGINAQRFQVDHSLSNADIVWDAVAGVKGKVLLDGPWSLPYRLDIGAGDSNLTWQINAGVAYRWKQAEMALTYRYMDWDLNDKSMDDLTFSGPQLSASWNF